MRSTGLLAAARSGPQTDQLPPRNANDLETVVLLSSPDPGDVRVSPDQDYISSGRNRGVRGDLNAYIDEDAGAQHACQRLGLAGIGKESTRDIVDTVAGVSFAMQDPRVSASRGISSVTVIELSGE